MHWRRRKSLGRALLVLVAPAAAVGYLVINHRLIGPAHVHIMSSRSDDRIVQGAFEYWSDLWFRTSARLGLRLEKLPDSVVQVIRSAHLSDAEIEEVRRQRQMYYEDDSPASVRVTLEMSTLIFMLSLLCFEILLRGPPGSLRRALGVPRLALASTGLGGPAEPNRTASKELGRSRSWITTRVSEPLRCQVPEMLRAVLTVDDSKVLESAGLDALVMLRFCALCGRFCAVAGAGCLLLVPLYATGGNWILLGRQGLSRYSLSNLQHGSLSLWAVVPAAYFCNWVLCGLLWTEFECFVRLRRRHLGGAEGPPSRPERPSSMDDAFLEGAEFPWQRGLTPPAQMHAVWRGSHVLGGHMMSGGPAQSVVSPKQVQRTVFLERIPQELREPAVLRACFEELLGVGTVHSVAMVPPDSGKLWRMLQEHRRLSHEGGDLGSLIALEERLRSRREEFGRAMAGPRGLCRISALQLYDPTDQLVLHHLDLSSLPTAAPAAGPTPSETTPGTPQTRFSTTGTSMPAESSRVGRLNPRGLSWASTNSDEARGAGCGILDWTSCRALWRELWLAGSLSFRTAARSVCEAARALVIVVREVTGATLLRMGQLLPASAAGHFLPASALGTPARTAVGTPLYERAETLDPRRWPERTTSRVEQPRSAFVTFRSLQAACIACQVVLDEDISNGSEMLADPAPEPRDVIWRNAAKPQGQRLVRQFFIEIVLIVGLVFWAVPVSLLQAWCSMARLQQLLGFRLAPNLARSYLYTLLTLYLPVVALLGLLEALPVLVRQLAKRYEGIKFESGLQMLTMQRYWRFQLATIVVTVLSGSISDSLRAILDNPPSVLWQLGQTLPNVSVYFLVTVLTSALVVQPLSLLRLPFVARWACRKLTRWVRRNMRHRVVTPLAGSVSRDFLESPDHCVDLSSLLLVLLVCVAYATISPIILPAGLLFFVIKWFVLAVQYLYVRVPCFDSGGAFWYLLWNQALLALVFGNLTTLAVVCLRCGYAQAPFLLPLPVLPIGFKMRAEYRFAEPSRRLPLRLARELDAQDLGAAEQFDPYAYWHPALRLAECELLTGRDGGSLDVLAERLESEDLMSDLGTPARGVTPSWQRVPSEVKGSSSSVLS